jgi:hypothetical protein
MKCDMETGMGARVWLVGLRLALGATLFLITDARAENPKREKCTCDLVTGATSDNGASVVNATVCWSTEDIGRQWCDITVQSLGGSVTHQSVVAALLKYSGAPEALAAVLKEQAADFFNAYKDADSAIHFDVAKAQEQVSYIADKNSESIAICVGDFEAWTHGRREFKGISEPLFSCSVGATSGWLRIAFQVDDIWIVYMVAPNG